MATFDECVETMPQKWQPWIIELAEQAGTTDDAWCLCVAHASIRSELEARIRELEAADKIHWRERSDMSSKNYVLDKRVRELEAGLRNLSNEVHSLGAFEEEVRLAIGNTNFACLMQRKDEARRLLEAGK